MATKPKSALDRGLIAAIDLGASKVACVIAQLTPVVDGGFEADVVGVGQHGALARGKTLDVENSLRAAVESAERMAGGRIASAFVAASGRSLVSRRVAVDIDIDGVVTTDDIEDCLDHGAAQAVIDGARRLHALKIRFALDGEPLNEPPEGLAGAVLTAEMLGLSVRETHSANIDSLLARAGLELAGLIAGPLAAAEAVILEDEKELGALVIDIGARTTDFACYDKGALVALGGAPLGGENITRDIAQIFGTPLASAERIKTLYGAAISGPGDEHRLVDFPQLGDSGEVVRQSRQELSAVIGPRLDEIFELTAAALPEGARRSARRAIITGGGSLLIGARETAERILAMKTRLGRPAALAGAPDAATAPQFAVALGLVQHAAKAQAQSRRPRRPSPMRVAAGGSLVTGIASWLKANF
jgi:cell division protein FtsA